MSKILFMPFTIFRRNNKATADMLKNLANESYSGTQDAIRNFNPTERKLYEHYRKSLNSLIHNDNSKMIQDYNAQVMKDAGDALDAYAPYQFSHHELTKKIKQEKNSFKREELTRQLELYISAIKRKVISLVQQETAEAKETLKSLALKNVKSLSERILNQAGEREVYTSQANKILKSAGVTDFTLENDYLTLLAKAAEGKTLTLGEQAYLSELSQAEKSAVEKLDKMQWRAYRDSKKYAVSLEQLRRNTVAERIKAVEYNNSVIQAKGAERANEIINGFAG